MQLAGAAPPPGSERRSPHASEEFAAVEKCPTLNSSSASLPRFLTLPSQATACSQTFCTQQFGRKPHVFSCTHAQRGGQGQHVLTMLNLHVSKGHCLWPSFSPQLVLS